jgi:chaperonin GroES
MEEVLVKPLGDRVLLSETDAGEQKTSSGIIIPDSAKTEDIKTAKVVAIGPGIYTSSGTLIPMSVSVNDIVMIPPYHQGTEVKLNGKKYLLMRESEILMIKQ